MTRAPYPDRGSAGRALGIELHAYVRAHLTAGADLVVLGLPRGGVPVAAMVAAQLSAPLDVLVVRKLGLPGRPELAMGAIADVGDSVEVIDNDAVLSRASVPQDAYDRVFREELIELRRRVASYRDAHAAVPVRDKAVIVVDDGLATGSTMRAAVAALRRQQPARLIVAVPVGSSATCRALREVADDVVCPWTPEPFTAVGQAYRDFSATTDEEVRRLLDRPLGAR